MTCLLAVLAMIVAPARLAHAEATDASLTLQMAHTAKGETTRVKGVEVTIYRVASLDENINHYMLLDDFSTLDVVFDEGVDAAQMEKLAADALKLAKGKKVAGTKVTSDAQGAVAFGTLPYGVYLVAQTGATGDAENYEDFKPFLISVPQLTANEIVYEVSCLPKLTPEPAEPTKPTTPTTPAKPRTPLAKTGDENNLQLWLGCMAVGGLMVLLGVAGKRRLDRKQK